MPDVTQVWHRSLDAPGHLQTFADGHDRRRLSGPAVRAFRKLTDRWMLGTAEASALLSVSPGNWDRVKAGIWDGELSQDQLTRVSALIGVFNGLHLLFADSMADRWPRLANRGPIFERRAPIEAMIEGGILRVLETREYVDALCGGF